MTLTLEDQHSRQAGGDASATGGGARAGGPRQPGRFQYNPPTYRPASELQSAWVELLDRYHWDLFGSLTFREDTHPESAYKRFRLFLSMLNRKLYGPRWFKHNKGISYCLALEKQRRGVVHFHCLLADPELVPMLKAGWFQQDNGRWSNELNEMWNELAGFARVQPVEQREAVTRYCSKYVVKGGEIELGGPLMQRRLEQAGPVGIGQPSHGVSLHRAGYSGLGKLSASVPGLPAGATGSEGRVPSRSTGASAPSFLPGQECTSSGLVEVAQEHSGDGRSAVSSECAPVAA